MPHKKQKTISLSKATIYCLTIFILSFLAGFLLERNVFSSLSEKRENFSVLQQGDVFDQNLFKSVVSDIKKHYLNQPVKDKTLFYGALKGMVESLNDPYSAFLDPEEMSKFLESMSSKFEGVGMQIGIKNDTLTVIAPLEGTPADRAGIKAGDKILAIDNQPSATMSPSQAANLIRGKKGTTVVLTIKRKNWTETKDFSIVRDLIKIKTVKWEKKNNRIAYLKISGFTDSTWKEFKKIALDVERFKPKAIILDLRNNPGGYLSTAVNIAGFWLDKDLLVTVAENANQEKKEYRAKNGKGEFANLPTVVLINQGSASGAEILAGALADHKKAILIGETTFGKGSVQEMESYSDGSGLKLTIAHWFTPNGHLINEVGIKPDIEIERTPEDFNNDRDPQMEKALEYINSLLR